MKYTKEICEQIVLAYQAGVLPETIAAGLEVPTRSVVAKLSSLGVYRRQEYVNKRGEPPEKKSAILDRLALLLGVDCEQVESLEKANKWVLLLLEQRLQAPK